jgi:hypothetical protein
MKALTSIGLMALSIAAAAAGPARAGPWITILPESGTPFTVTDTGGCGIGGCIPVGLTGFISGGVGNGQAAPNMVLSPGRYVFTFMGRGDAADVSQFTVGGNVIRGDDPIGTRFAYTVDVAGDLPFTYTNLRTGYSISDSAVSPTQDLAYGLFSKGPGLAYIALTDVAYPGDHDFQDLGIQVSIPEVSTWSMLLGGFAGLGYAAFRRSRARPAIV